MELFYYPHSVHEKNEVSRGQPTCPKIHRMNDKAGTFIPNSVLYHSTDFQAQSVFQSTSYLSISSLCPFSLSGYSRDSESPFYR